MYDQETVSRLVYGLQIRQLKLGRRMNCLALRDGLRNDRIVGSIAGTAVGEECMTRRLHLD